MLTFSPVTVAPALTACGLSRADPTTLSRVVASPSGSSITAKPTLVDVPMLATMEKANAVSTAVGQVKVVLEIAATPLAKSGTPVASRSASSKTWKMQSEEAEIPEAAE